MKDEFNKVMDYIDEKSKKLNIKHKKSNSTIYYGVRQETGELVNIEDAERGLASNCVCLACKMPLEARKGEERKHHFAHESNTECFYSSEISVYRAFYDLLNKKKKFCFPDIILNFDSGKKAEVIKKGELKDLTHSDFLYEFKNYPPELICYIKEKKFQIILDFDNYFSDTDYQTIREYGKENNITILSIHLPNIESLASFEELEKYIDTSEHKKWIYNLRGENLVKLWDENYDKIAKSAQFIYHGYRCPAQKSKYKDIYCFAEVNDCKRCQYCYKYNRNENEIKCTANSYINHIEDFSKTEAELKKQFNEVNHIKPITK